MNRSSTLALGTGLAAGLALGFGAGALARRARRHRGPADAAELDARVERMLKHLYAAIDATDEQKAKLGPIVKEAGRDLLPLRYRLREVRREGLELLQAEAIDGSAIERLRAEQMAIAGEASKRFAQALVDAAAVLTAHQRRALAERIAQRRARWRRR